MTGSEMDPNEMILPWSYWDGTVETELRVDSLQFADDASPSIVRVALGRRSDGQTITVRLPAESATRLALAILGELTPPPPPLTEDPVAKRLGLVPCCDSHNVHCEPPSELCCEHCTEVRHPEHFAGVTCVLDEQEILR